MNDGKDDMADRGPARGARRDSLFLLTVLSSPEGFNLGSARIRNLSATGLMADCERPFRKGDRVSMTLRGVGKVQGVIAWAKVDRVGIAFDTNIDPHMARKPVGQGKSENAVPDYLRTVSPRRGTQRIS